MKSRRMFWMAIPATIFFLFSCSTYENEKNIAIHASDVFYSEFNEDKFQSILENRLDSEVNDLRNSSLIKRLQTIKNAVGTVSGRILKKTKVRGSRENSTIISCFYQIETEDGVYYQELIWRVDKENAKLREALTFSVNSKGEPQIMIVDGKLLF